MVSCAPPPPPTAVKKPPPLQTVRVLDHRSFAFAVTFLGGDQVGCALMEQGTYKLAIYDGRSGKRLKQLPLGPGQDWLHAVALQPGGQLLAVAFRRLYKHQGRLSAGGSVVLYSLHTGRRLRSFALPTPVRALAFVERQLLVLGTEARYDRGRGFDRSALEPRQGTAQVCRLHLTRGLEVCVADHGDSVTAVVPLPGGGVATGSWDGTVRLREATLLARGEPLQAGAPVNALSLGLLPRASGSQPTSSPATPGPRIPGPPVLAVATSHHPPRRGRKIVLAEQQGLHRRGSRSGDTVQLWQLDSRRRLRLLRPHSSYVTAVALTPGGVLASGSWDWTVAVTRGRHTARLRSLSQIVTGLAFSPTSRTLAVSAWSEHRTDAPSCLLVRY